MAKDKSMKADKVKKSSKDTEVKPLSSVKHGAVTKPSQTLKSKSKEMAKQVAVKADKVDKKSKKAKKEPTPVSSSESDSGSMSSMSSDGESEDEEPTSKKATKLNGLKKNGVVNAVAAADNDDSDSASSASSSEDELPAPKTAPAAVAKAVAGAKDESDSADESEDPSEMGSSDEEDDENEAKGAIDANTLNGKLKAIASNEASSDEESDEESDNAGTSSGTSGESSSEDEEVTPAPKKRKADVVATPAPKKAKTDPSMDDSAKKNLFVGHLSWNVDEEWLTREFEQFGELSRVKVMMNNESGQSRGFGYVEYVNAEDGIQAQEAMHEKEIDGRTINVDFSKPRAEPGAPRQDRQKTYGDKPSAPSETIFVANLPFEVTEDAVADAFQAHGSVLGVRLPTDKDSGAPKGFGYVQFGSVDEAQVAFDNMNGAVIMGRPVRLDFSTPRPPREDSFGGRGGRGGGRGGRGGFDRGGRGGGRGRGGFDRGGRGGGRGGSTNRGGFGDFKGQKKTF